MQAVYTNKFKIILLMLVVDIPVNNLYIVMTLTNEALQMKNTRLKNIAQVMINGLKSNNPPKTYFIFSPEEAHYIIRSLDLFYTGKNTLDISLWDKSNKIAIQVNYNMCFTDKPFISLLSSQKEELTQLLHFDNKLQPVPTIYRKLIQDNFM